MLEFRKLIVTCSLAKKNNPQESCSSKQHFVLASPPLRNQPEQPLHQQQEGQIPWNQEKNLRQTQNKYPPSGAIWDRIQISLSPSSLYQRIFRSFLTSWLHPQLTLLEVLCLALFKCTTRPNQRMHQHQGNCSTQPGSLIQDINLGSSFTICTKRQNTRKKIEISSGLEMTIINWWTAFF